MPLLLLGQGCAAAPHAVDNPAPPSPRAAPAQGYIFARADTATTVTVALNNYVTGTVLASTTVTVPAGGAWTQLNYSLTPSAATNCDGIASGSDPNISCNNAFADYVCIKCAGELSFGLSAPGAVWIGYARLEPGSWGRWANLPIRLEAAQTLAARGVSVLRYGGAVGSSVAWEDFRGPVWNRTSLGRTWSQCDMWVPRPMAWPARACVHVLACVWVLGVGGRARARRRALRTSAACYVLVLPTATLTLQVRLGPLRRHRRVCLHEHLGARDRAGQ